jgi:hypothetical protein
MRRHDVVVVVDATVVDVVDEAPDDGVAEVVVVVGGDTGAAVGTGETVVVGTGDGAAARLPPTVGSLTTSCPAPVWEGVGAGGVVVVGVLSVAGPGVLAGTGIVAGAACCAREAGCCWVDPPGSSRRRTISRSPTAPSPASMPRRCDRGSPWSDPSSIPSAFMSIHFQARPRQRA